MQRTTRINTENFETEATHELHYVSNATQNIPQPLQHHFNISINITITPQMVNNTLPRLRPVLLDNHITVNITEPKQEQPTKKSCLDKLKSCGKTNQNQK